MIHRMAAFKPLGMFPIIMHEAIVNAFSGFIWVYALFLIALSTATFAAYQTASEDQEDFPKSSFIRTPHSLFKLTFGLLDTGYELQSRFTYLGLMLFVFYLTYGNIILMNVLIAMVNDTYKKIFDITDKCWIEIQLGYVLLIESWFPFVKRRYQMGDLKKHLKEKDEPPRRENIFFGKEKGTYLRDKNDQRHYIVLPTSRGISELVPNFNVR